MDLDSIWPVDNMSDLTIQTLVDRLERSRTQEHFVYRETELDELWRLVEVAARIGDSEGHRTPQQLAAMRDAVHLAHDLVGMECKPVEAAEALRGALG